MSGIENKQDYNPNDWIMAGSEHYIVKGHCETVILYMKNGTEISIIGDFYGNPEGGFIDRNENYCVLYGCGVIVYRLQEPFEEYKYNTATNQWYEFNREGNNIRWIDDARQIDDYRVELTDEYGSKWEFEVERSPEIILSLDPPFYKKNHNILSYPIQEMRLISNNLCFGPPPDPDEEIEQHLSISADGNVHFTAYTLGDLPKSEHQKKRSSQFIISQLEATYVLSHVAMFFSKTFSIDLATDVGWWELELITTDGSIYKVQGFLFEDLMVDGVGLSFLLRKHLGMDDLFGFDGEAYFPISLKEGEYIFVNVSFEQGGRTYCYLCDDEQIKPGKDVFVPIGPENILKAAHVENVVVSTVENVPYPVDKCKKIVRKSDMES